MISFKHILVTFTILSASIWFMPVTSYTTEQQQDSCIRFMTACTHYENKIEDYDKTESTADIKFTSENFSLAVTAETQQAIAEFYRLMMAMDKDPSEHVVKERAVEIAKAVRKAYTEDLKLVNINNRKPNPAQIFCESKITTGKNEILGIITQVLTS